MGNLMHDGLKEMLRSGKWEQTLKKMEMLAPGSETFDHFTQP